MLTVSTQTIEAAASTSRVLVGYQEVEQEEYWNLAAEEGAGGLYRGRGVRQWRGRKPASGRVRCCWTRRSQQGGRFSWREGWLLTRKRRGFRRNGIRWRRSSHRGRWGWCAWRERWCRARGEQRRIRATRSGLSLGMLGFPSYSCSYHPLDQLDGRCAEFDCVAADGVHTLKALARAFGAEQRDCAGWRYVFVGRRRGR